MAKNNNVVSSLFEEDFGSGKSIAQQRKERKLFMNRKSYFRREARNKLGNDSTIKETIKRIDEAQSNEEIDVVKDFFKNMRVIRNKKADSATFDDSFAKVLDFLKQDGESLAESTEAKQEDEYLTRLLPIGSDGLAMRITQVHDSEGTLAALNLMDDISTQGHVTV